MYIAFFHIHSDFPMQSFTDLLAWQVAIDLAKEIHRIIAILPREERDVTGKQLRKAVKSILANIAEGFGRHTYPDKAAKYAIARGENSEVKAFLLIAVALRFMPEKEIEKAVQLSDRVGRLLSGLISSCRKRC